MTRVAASLCLAALIAAGVAVAAPSADPPSPSPAASGLPLPPEPSPQPTLEATPAPPPIALQSPSMTVPLGHEARVRVLSPPSGILLLSGFDATIVGAVFNPIDRTIDLTGRHGGSTIVTAADQYGHTASLSVIVQPYAGKAYASTAATISGDPASAQFVADEASRAAVRVAYPLPEARVDALPSAIDDARALPADNVEVVHVPISITGPNLYPYHRTIEVTISNLAQPRLPPKYVLVSDFPETITENGTLFYADVNPDSPARLLYYHYANAGAPLRRVLVKVQNNGVASSLIQLTAGISGPDQNILMVGHESTKRFLREEAAGEGEVFEVPPHATINLVDQLLPALSLVSGLMQVRVLDGDGVRLAIVVQDAGDSPVEPISDSLLSSAVRHARGIYQVPDFLYDEEYVVGGPPAILNIGKLPLPNLVQGEVLGGDYGVKQSAVVTLVNTGDSSAQVGMWFEPRGGRATGTFFVDGTMVELRATNPGAYALIRTFAVPAHGYSRVNVLTMPEGGSSYPINVLFTSNAPN